MSIISEFSGFMTKGNVIDLAVAFVMGAAFNALVTALVTDIVVPLIGLPGHVNFASWSIPVGNSIFLTGAFINAAITFLSVAVAVFFFIVKPMEKVQAKIKQPEPKAEAKTKDCPYCLSSIPAKAVRCAFCTSKLD